MPYWPTFTPDGEHILFMDFNRGGHWIVGADGSGPSCITCAHADKPKGNDAGFSFATPGGQRMFFSTRELGLPEGADGPDEWVLECAPSLLNCATHRYVPVDLSADNGTVSVSHRRTRISRHILALLTVRQ